MGGRSAQGWRCARLRSRQRTAACLKIAVLALVWLAAPSGVLAHGLRRPEEILRAPGNPDHIVVRSDLMGVIRTRDGGETWEWICAEAGGSMRWLEVATTERQEPR